ncbi:MAG: 30S ribosome-binding factor RbfA [Succinivibrionaceae bacterium]|nr:30S ribosome-binding factor RbfA [Succinivibrionaceae bacterium]
MARLFSRSRRVAEQLQKEIAEVLQREFKDPRVGFVTVSGVDLSNDLMYSKVYVTFLNMEKDKIGEAVKVLNGAVGFFRSMVGKKMKLRVVPNITFVYDDTLVKGMELSELITKSVRHDHELQEQNQEKQQPDVDEQ